MLTVVNSPDCGRFCEDHGYQKPNDDRGISLMSQAARSVMLEFRDVALAYGQSDEYSFVLRPSTTLFERRASKLTSLTASLFASSFVYHWREQFPDTPLRYPPQFDARVVCYPTRETLLDYLSWRQADCHVNNLYNTTFWTLVQKEGKTTREAHQALSGTRSADKHEIMFKHGINYDKQPEVYKKGTVLVWLLSSDPDHPKRITDRQLLTLHESIIPPAAFWDPTRFGKLLDDK